MQETLFDISGITILRTKDKFGFYEKRKIEYLGKGEKILKYNGTQVMRFYKGEGKNAVRKRWLQSKGKKYRQF